MTAAPYPITYQPETSPSRLHYAAALSGCAARDVTRPFRYLELGCGRGYSALVHAAGHPQGTFVAIDRDAAAIAQAHAWAEACGLTNIQFRAASFEDACLEALPRFDVIALHGVYSWVGPATRARLRKLARDLLAPGGLCYVSYNCLPGWAAELPLRKLLGEFGADRGIASAVQELSQFTGLGYFKAHPAAERAVRAWAGQPESYLAQEYLAEACEPLWSVDVMDEMAAADLAWIASATPYDAHIALLIGDDAAQTIAALSTPRLRRLALDFAVNRAFRRDVFLRGEPARADAALEGIVIGPAGAAIPQSILMPRGRIRFHADFVAALERLTADRAFTLGQATSALGGPEGLRNLLWLIAAGVLAPLPPDPVAEAETRETLRTLGVSPVA